MQERVGKYVIDGLIASGGMAQIYRARTQGPGGIEKVLAVKRLLPHYASDANFVNMLINEARLSVQLNHKNVCQIFDLEQDEQTYFIAMEYIDGRDLLRLIERFREDGQLMPIELALYLAQEICSGLSYAHRKRDARGRALSIVHRDISPQNVLISFEGEVKIVDFGIAKAAYEVSISETGEIKGKFQYMSPEQARGERLEATTDIFSVGAVLYEMVTGFPIYHGEDNEMRLMQLARRGQFPAPRERSPDVPERLEKIILKALARDVSQRFRTAQDLQIALSQYMFELGTPCDELRLSQIMRQSFREGVTAHASQMFNLAEVDPDAAMRRDDYQTSSHSVISRLPELGGESGDFVQASVLHDGASKQEVVAFESAPTIAEQPAFDPSLYRKKQAEADESAPTIAEHSAFDPETFRSDQANSSGDVTRAERPGAKKAQGPALQRAAMPTRPDGPSIEIDRSGYEHSTQLEMATYQQKPREDEGPQKKLMILAVAIVGIIVIISLMIALSGGSGDDDAPESRQKKPARVAWKIQSVPEGAHVFINGEDSGETTPAVLTSVASGDLLELRLEGYYPVKTPLNAEKGKKNAVSLALPPSSWRLEIDAPSDYDVMFDVEDPAQRRAKIESACPVRLCVDGLVLENPAILLVLKPDADEATRHELRWDAARGRVIRTSPRDWD